MISSYSPVSQAPIELPNAAAVVDQVPQQSFLIKINRVAHCVTESTCMANEWTSGAIIGMGGTLCQLMMVPALCASTYFKCRVLPPVSNVDRSRCCPSPRRFWKVYLIKGFATTILVGSGFAYGYLRASNKI